VFVHKFAKIPKALVCNTYTVSVKYMFVYSDIEDYVLFVFHFQHHVIRM